MTKQLKSLTLFISTVCIFIILSWLIYGLCGNFFINPVHSSQKAEVFLLRFSTFVLLSCVISFFFISLNLKKYVIALSISFSLLIAGTFLYIFLFGKTPVHYWGFDDAYITYNYARNFAEGHGLVFNPGERVEGYSNFLYTLLMAAGIWLTGASNVYFFSTAVNLLFAVAAVFLFYRYVKIDLGEDRAIFSTFLISFCLPIWRAIGSGLETPLTLFTVVAFWFVVERIANNEDSKDIPLHWLISMYVLIVFSNLLRADGFIISGIAIIYLVIRGKIRAAFYCSICFIVSLAVYFLWRYHYYGFWLPNTYYAKVSGPFLLRMRQGMTRLMFACWKTGLWVYLLLVFFTFLEDFQKRSYRLFKIQFFYFFSACWVFYWVYIGGDHYDERFLVILFPLGIYALVKFVDKNLPSKITVFLIALFLSIHLIPIMGGIRKIIDPRLGYDCWIELGKFLKEKYAGKTLAIDGAGKVPYFSRLKTYDMLGINDVYIAHKKVDFFTEPGHDKYDPEYIYSKKPDLIMSWFKGSNLDLKYDIFVERYTQNSYALKYILLTEKYERDGESIIDVSKFTPDEVRRAKDKGYYFAVLEKIK